MNIGATSEHNSQCQFGIWRWEKVPESIEAFSCSFVPIPKPQIQGYVHETNVPIKSKTIGFCSGLETGILHREGDWVKISLKYKYQWLMILSDKTLSFFIDWCFSIAPWCENMLVVGPWRPTFTQPSHFSEFVFSYLQRKSHQNFTPPVRVVNLPSCGFKK